MNFKYKLSPGNFHESLRLISIQAKRQLAVLLFLTVCAAAAEFYVLNLFLPLISILQSAVSPIHSDTISTDFSTTGILFCFIVLVSGSLKIINIKLSTRLTSRIASELSSNCYANIIKTKYSVLSAKNKNHLVAVCTSQMSQATVAISSALNLCISLALASTILYVLLMKEPLMTLLITFIAAIVYITINFIFSKRLKLNSRLVKKMIDLQQQITTESLHLHKEIVVGNDYDRFINLFSSSDNQMRTRQAENSFISGFPKYALESAMLVTIVGIAVIQISYNEGSELL